MVIGRRIKERRAKLGLSQRDLGRLIEMDKNQVQEIESRTRVRHTSTVHKLAKALKCTSSYLMGEIDTLIRIKNELKATIDEQLEENAKPGEAA